MRNNNNFELTPAEAKAIRILRKLEKEWPKSLWLFSASGTLCVMRKNEKGGRALRSNGGVDDNYTITTVDIPNDGGDW